MSLSTKSKLQPAIVLIFGGPGREGVISHLFSEGFAIAALAVPEKPRKKQSSSIRAAVSVCTAQRVPVLRITRENLEHKLEPYDGAILFNVGGEFFLPDRVRERFEICINLHPTLLPKYRGNTSIANVILNQDDYHGSTVHVMDDTIDGGLIVHQARFPVSPDDTYATLKSKAYALEPELAVRAIMKIQSRTAEFKPQNLSDVFTGQPRTPEDSRIDPHRPLIELVDEIRACDPVDFPAFFEMGQQRIIVTLKYV